MRSAHPAAASPVRSRAIGLALAVSIVLPALMYPVGTASADRHDVGDQPDVVTAPSDRLPPRPTEISYAEEPPEGEVGFDHAVVWLDLDGGEAGQPELAITNGGEGTVTFGLEARAVIADEQGAPLAVTSADEEVLPDASGWVTLAEDEVHLDPGERARLWPTVAVPEGVEGGVHLAAIHAEAPEGETPVAISLFLAIDVGEEDRAGTPDLGVALEQRAQAARALVSLESGGSVDVVGGDLRVHGWFDTIEATTDLPATLLLPGVERRVPVEVSTPWVPGRYTAEVTVEGRSGEVIVASGSAWLWRWEVAVGIAVVLLLASLVALLLVVRRRSRHRPLSAEPGASEAESA